MDNTNNKTTQKNEYVSNRALWTIANRLDSLIKILSSAKFEAFLDAIAQVKTTEPKPQEEFNEGIFAKITPTIDTTAPALADLPFMEQPTNVPVEEEDDTTALSKRGFTRTFLNFDSRIVDTAHHTWRFKYKGLGLCGDKADINYKKVKEFRDSFFATKLVDIVEQGMKLGLMDKVLDHPVYYGCKTASDIVDAFLLEISKND